MRRLVGAAVLALMTATGTPLAAPPPGTEPGMDVPAVPPAPPTIAADSPEASRLPRTTRTVIDNTLPPPPAEALNKSYPPCTATLRDNCQNPGEGGAPGRSRASDLNRPHHPLIAAPGLIP